MQQATGDRFNTLVSQFQNALERTERAPLDQLERYRNGLLEKLVRHARGTTPFYRKRLDCLFRNDGTFDLSRWRDIPLLTREGAERHQDDLRSLDVPTELGKVYVVPTTGTTGQPMNVAYNALARVAGTAAFRRTMRWWNLDITSKSMARVIVYPKDERKAVSYPDGRRNRGMTFSDIRELEMLTPVRQQVEWLSRNRADYLLTSPVNATALAFAMPPEQARGLGFKAILAHGETVLPLARKVVPERFGAPMIAFYSCQEAGYVATQCPAAPHYHIAMENVLVEVLRDDGTAAPPGEPGQVVLTGFYNYAMPFIRYAIGDVATLGAEPCPCGRTLPIITDVDGRTRNAFQFGDDDSDRSYIWPRMILFDISSFVDCREFQLVQLDRRNIELRYVPASGRPPDQAGLDAYIKRLLHPTANTVAVAVDAIPKGPGGKLTPFVSLVG